LMLQQAAAGDTLSFWQLGSLSPRGSGTVIDAVRQHGTEFTRMAEEAYIAVNSNPYSQHIGHAFGNRVWLVNWSQPVANLATLDLVDMPRLRPHGAIVRGNYMHDSYMRFGLYDSPGMVIEGNVFERGFPMCVKANSLVGMAFFSGRSFSCLHACLSHSPLFFASFLPPFLLSFLRCPVPMCCSVRPA